MKFPITSCRHPLCWPASIRRLSLPKFRKAGRTDLVLNKTTDNFPYFYALQMLLLWNCRISFIFFSRLYTDKEHKGKINYVTKCIVRHKAMLKAKYDPFYRAIWRRITENVIFFMAVDDFARLLCGSSGRIIANKLLVE